MKILVYGIGAMGSIYASLMSDAGNDVFVVDKWKEHIKRIQESGLKVHGASGNRITKQLKSFYSVPQNETFELIIIATKASGVENASFELKNCIQKNTIILSIQNGLGSSEKLTKHIPEKNILLGVADGFGASIVSPGEIHHNAMKLIRIGEINGGQSIRLKKVLNLFLDAGFNSKIYENINQLIWEKFICNVTFSAPCTVYNCNIGQLMKTKNLWKVALGCTQEAYDIAIRKNIPLSFENPIEYVTDFGSKMPNAKPSMLLDHESKRKSEIDFINGKVAEIGNDLDMPTPYNLMLSEIIKIKEKSFL